MRIVSRDEFMLLPVGTVFQKYRPYILEELKTKGETIFDNDEVPIDWFECPVGAEAMINKPPHYIELSCIESRDGIFQHADQFLVYESQDVQLLVDKLVGNPINVTHKLEVE